MVAAGSTLTLDVKGQAGQWLPRTPGEIRAQILNNLTPHFDVFDVVMTKGNDSILATAELWNWSFTAVVTLRTREDYGESGDVASIVASVVNDASGTMPAVSVRGSGLQLQPDVDNSPSLGNMLALAAVGLVAVAAIVYLPKPR